MPKAVMCLLLAMLSIACGASLAKQLFPIIGTELTIALRLGIGTAMLFVVFRPWRSMPTRIQLKPLLFYGITLGLMNFTFYLSLERIPLGIAIALEFTGPLFIALMGSRHWQDFLWVVFAVTGIGLLLPIGEVSSSLDPVGIVLALVAGAMWALYIVAGKRLSAHGQADAHSGTTVAWGMLIAAFVVAPLSISSPHLDKLLDPTILVWVLGVALLSSALAYSLEMAALKKLEAKTYGIMTSMEPALGSFAGFVFLAERLSFIQIVAVGCIITASIGSLYVEHRRSQKELMVGV